MPLVTPEELIKLLDLPHNTQPTDRAQLICDLVVDDINRVAGSTLVEPFAAGLKGIALMAAARLYDNPSQLWSERVDNQSSVFPGSRGGDGPSVLTDGEVERVCKALGTAGPQWSFPVPDWSWGPVATTTQE